MVDQVSSQPGSLLEGKMEPNYSHVECRLRALVAKRDWNEIEEIGKARKSPIGWEVSEP